MTTINTNENFLRSIEGGVTLQFLQKHVDVSGLDVLEIGPKHGLHSSFLSRQNPKSYTIVELPHKDIEWSEKLDFKHFDIKLGWFQEMEFDKKYDCIICAGVIYHNIDQMHILIKINKMLKPDGILILESSTSRNKEYMDKCVIEIHHPKRYNEVDTIKFHPTKKALKAMAEIAGFEILAEEGSTEIRENLYCKKVSIPDYGYKDKNEDILR